MLGLGKRKMSRQQLGELFAQAILAPLERPSDQDRAFLSEAISVGVEELRFKIEQFALEAFTLGAALNTVWREGKFRIQDPQSFCVEYLRFAYTQLETSQYAEDSVALIDIIADRADDYGQPSNFIEPTRQIPRLFSEFCGFPESDVLQSIGWSIFAMRGNKYMDFLTSIKLV